MLLVEIWHLQVTHVIATVYWLMFSGVNIAYY